MLMEISIVGAERSLTPAASSTIVKGLLALINRRKDDFADVYLDGVHIGSVNIRDGSFSVEKMGTPGEHTIKLVGADVYSPARGYRVLQPLFSFEKKFCIPECERFRCHLRAMIIHHEGNHVDFGPWDEVKIDCQTFVTA